MPALVRLHLGGALAELLLFALAGRFLGKGSAPQKVMKCAEHQDAAAKQYDVEKETAAEEYQHQQGGRGPSSLGYGSPR